MAIDGSYKIVSESQMGKTEAVLHFRTDGNVLTGTNEVMGRYFRFKTAKSTAITLNLPRLWSRPWGKPIFSLKEQ